MLEGFHALKHALRFGAEVVRVVAVDPAAVERMAVELAPDLVGRLPVAEAVAAEVFEQASPRPPRTGVVAIARRLDDLSAEPQRVLERVESLDADGVHAR